MVKKWVIIVGGGSGTRMGTEIPKQFLLLHNKPVIIHTIQQFLNAMPDINIVVVLPEAHQQTFFDMASSFNIDSFQIANGGATRFQSVSNGLKIIDAEDTDIIAVHDAVRPLISIQLIRKLFKEAESAGALVPVVDVKESLRKLEGSVSVAVERIMYKLVQTPQLFKAKILKTAYKQEESITFTDDASVVEQSGENILLTEGEEENIKITHPADLDLAELIYKKRNTNQTNRPN